MKTISVIVLLVLFLSADVQAQQPTFTLPTEIGQGFKFIDSHNPQFYSLQVSTKPTYTTADGKLSLSAIGMTSFSDGITDYFVGNGVSYKILATKNYNIIAGITALFGTNERQLFGGSIAVDKDLFYIIVNARQEYTRKEFWFDGAIGIKLFQ